MRAEIRFPFFLIPLCGSALDRSIWPRTSRHE
jgi:hypothetical protein